MAYGPRPRTALETAKIRKRKEKSQPKQTVFRRKIPSPVLVISREPAPPSAESKSLSPAPAQVSVSQVETWMEPGPISASARHLATTRSTGPPSEPSAQRSRRGQPSVGGAVIRPVVVPQAGAGPGIAKTLTCQSASAFQLKMP